MNLIEFLKQENASLVQDHQNLERLKRMYHDLGKLFDAVPTELPMPGKSKLTRTSPKEPQLNQIDSSSSSPTSTLVKSVPVQQARPKSSCSTATIERTRARSRSFHKPTTIDDCPETFQIGSQYDDRVTSQSNRITKQLHPTTRDALKMKQYRQELQEQIREKMEFRKRQEAAERLQDEVLEKRIAHQQLKMYTEYVDEQKSGLGFLTKPSDEDNGSIAKLLASLEEPRSKVLNGDSTFKPNGKSRFPR